MHLQKRLRESIMIHIGQNISIAWQETDYFDLGISVTHFRGVSILLCVWFNLGFRSLYVATYR